jgi:hypothetical protein
VNWEAVSAIGQIVGGFAVVVSLIYLAREIRSNARSARIASLHDINRWLGELVEHPHLAELYYRGIQDFRSLKSGDVVRFSTLMNQLFRTVEEMYYLQAADHLEKGVWHGWEAAHRDFNAYPGVEAWWRLRSHWFSEGVCEVRRPDAADSWASKDVS